MSHYRDSLRLNKNDTAACLTHGSCFAIIQGFGTVIPIPNQRCTYTRGY